MKNCVILLVAVSIWLIFITFDKREMGKETLQYEVVIKKKYSEQVSTNNFGAFRNRYYFLYDNGHLTPVELEEFIKFEVGDTLVITEDK